MRGQTGVHVRFCLNSDDKSMRQRFDAAGGRWIAIPDSEGFDK